MLQYTTPSKAKYLAVNLDLSKANSVVSLHIALKTPVFWASKPARFVQSHNAESANENNNAVKNALILFASASNTQEKVVNSCFVCMHHQS